MPFDGISAGAIVVRNARNTSGLWDGGEGATECVAVALAGAAPFAARLT
jgi:hypothetical protein